MLNKKNSSIELLRFLFCIMIMIFHGKLTFYQGDAKWVLFQQGAIGVEFFFVLSGMMMMQHINKCGTNERDIIKIGNETVHYMKKKYCNIFPVHLCIFIILFFETIVLNGYTFKKALTTLLYALPELFLVQMSGVQYVRLNINDWYLSALFIASFLLYPIMRRFGDFFAKVIAPIVSMIILGMLFQTTGSLTPTDAWIGCFFKGTWRAIAELCLGAVVYRASVSLNKTPLTDFAKWLVRILETGCYVTVFVFSCSSVGKRWCFIGLFLISCGLVISYSQYSIFAKISDNSVVRYLGKLSLHIFLAQWVCLNFLEKYMVNHSYAAKQVVYVISTIVLSVCVQVFVDAVRKKGNVKGLFVKNEI